MTKQPELKACDMPEEIYAFKMIGDLGNCWQDYGCGDYAPDSVGAKYVRADVAPTSQWRDISTLKYAPMSGYVLLCVGHGSIFIGLRNVDGDVVCTEIGKDGLASKCGATHWMPLPAPPTKDLADAEGDKS